MGAVPAQANTRRFVGGINKDEDSMDRLQPRELIAPGHLPIRPGNLPSPMDLICERVERRTPRRRSGDRVSVDCVPDHRVHLPNPRYPMPAPSVIRLHCPQQFQAAQAWGALGPDALDVALNVMAAYMPFRISDRSGALRLADGFIVSRQAAQLYRPFAEDFLEQMSAEGGVVREAMIRSWIREREFMDELVA